MDIFGLFGKGSQVISDAILGLPTTVIDKLDDFSQLVIGAGKLPFQAVGGVVDWSLGLSEKVASSAAGSLSKVIGQPMTAAVSGSLGTAVGEVNKVNIGGLGLAGMGTGALLASAGVAGLGLYLVIKLLR